MTDLKALAAKIRALRVKAEDSASTEAEAMQAVSMIAKLLIKVDMSEGELMAQTGPTSDNNAVSGGYEYHDALVSAWFGIQALTETKLYKDRDNYLMAVGAEHDVEFALYPTALIVSSAERSWGNVSKALGSARKSRKSYMSGFSKRLKERLLELAEERRKAKTSTGTALVVSKESAISDFMASTGLVITRGRRIGDAGDPKAYLAGHKVGDAVTLNRPLSGSSTRGRLT